MIEGRAIRTAVPALAATFAIAGVAEANTIKHRGQIVGIESAKVKFAVKKEDGQLKKVTNLRFTQVPVTCEDGASGAVTAELPNFGLDGRKNFTRKGKLEGAGIKSGSLSAFGKFRKRGKKAKGTLKIAFKSESGAGCGTGALQWRTQ